MQLAPLKIIAAPKIIVPNLVPHIVLHSKGAAFVSHKVFCTPHSAHNSNRAHSRPHTVIVLLLMAHIVIMPTFMPLHSINALYVLPPSINAYCCAHYKVIIPPCVPPREVIKPLLCLLYSKMLIFVPPTK